MEVWRGERCLFEGLDFEIAAGQMALVLGQNGSGKTTLLRILAGLAPPTAGGVTWRGVAIQEIGPEARAEIAYRGHLDGLKKDLTVAENLTFYRALSAGREAIAPLLADLKLERVTDVRTRFLSAGQCRRAALAALRISGARLWILDEPTTNLDADGRQLVARWTKRHVADGGLAVIATHQPEMFTASGTLLIEL